MKKIKNLTMRHLDKVIHFLVCFLIPCVVYILSDMLGVAIWSGILAGVVKEAYDANERGNRWSWGDIIADGLGILAFLGIYYLKHWITP